MGKAGVSFNHRVSMRFPAGIQGSMCIWITSHSISEFALVASRLSLRQQSRPRPRNTLPQGRSSCDRRRAGASTA